MTKKRKLCLVSLLSCIFTLSGCIANGIVAKSAQRYAAQSTSSENIVITENFNLRTSRDGQFADFANPWGTYYSGGNVGTDSTGRLYEFRNNNDPVVIAESVVGDFNIACQPIQETHNVSDSYNSNGMWNLEYDRFILTFIDCENKNNVLELTFKDSGWCTTNIELSYGTRFKSEYNYWGSGFGGAGSSGWWTDPTNSFISVSFENIKEKYFDDIGQYIKGFETYDVTLECAGKYTKVKPANDMMKLMVYEVCNQKLKGEPLVDTSAPAFTYQVTEGVVGHKYQVVKIDKDFDYMEPTLSADKVVYTLKDANGADVSLADDYSFMPATAGNYTLNLSLSDTAGNVCNQDYVIKINQQMPAFTFDFDNTYRASYPQSYPLPIIVPAQITSKLAFGQVNYNVSIVKDGATLSTFKGWISGLSYKLSECGEYTIVYSATDNSGYEDSAEFTIQVTETPYVQEIADEEWVYGNTFTPQSLYASYKNSTKLMDTTVYNPRGAIVALDKNGNVKLNELGQWKVCYSATIAGEEITEEQVVSCFMKPSYLLDNYSGVNSITDYKDATKFTAGGNGLEIIGSEMKVNTKTVDLAALDTMTLMTFCGAFYDDVGYASSMTISLVDKHDASNRVSVYLWQSPWNRDVIYVRYNYTTVKGENLGVTYGKNSSATAIGKAYDGTTVSTTSISYEGKDTWSVSLQGGLDGLKDMSLTFNYATGDVYAINNTSKALFSISNGAHVGYGNEWKGFTSSEVYISIEAATATTSGITIKSLFGMSCAGAAGTNFQDKENPTIFFSANAHYDSVDNLPKGVVNEWYSIPEVKIVDNLSGVKTQSVTVFDSQGLFVDIVNGAFKPLDTGKHTIVYKAEDLLGNKTEKRLYVQVVAQETIEFAWATDVPDAYAGNEYVIPEINVESNLGKVVYTEKFYIGNQEVVLKNRKLTLTSKESIKVVITANSYIGKTVTKEFVIPVQAKAGAVLFIDKGMPDAFYLNEEVTVNDFQAINFNYDEGDSKYYAEKWITVNGIRKNTTTFTITEDLLDGKNYIDVVYCASSDGVTTMSETYRIQVLNPTYIEDYFYANTAYSVVRERLYTSFVFQSASTLYVANPLSAQGLEFKFGVTSSAMKSVSILLEDYYDSSNAVKLTFRYYNNNNYILYLNDDTSKSYIAEGKLTSSGDSLTIQYINDGFFMADSNGNKVCDITTTMANQKFIGFTENMVRVRFIVDCNSHAGLNLYTIGNQRINNKYSGGKYVAYVDTTEPMIMTSATLQNIKLDYNETFTLPSARAVDFCQHNVQVALTLKSPSQNVLLDKVDCSNEREYVFNEYGTYEIIYTMSVGGKTYEKLYRLVVVDDVAPTLTVNCNREITLKIGEKFVVPNAEYSDNLGIANLTIFIVDDMYLVSVQQGESISFDKAGNYKLRYYVFDDTYNTSEVVINITVK